MRCPSAEPSSSEFIARGASSGPTTLQEIAADYAIGVCATQSTYRYDPFQTRPTPHPNSRQANP
jgi:hypothetical protein